MSECPFDGHHCSQRKIFHVTEIEDKEITEVHICSECLYDPFEEGEVEDLINKVMKEEIPSVLLLKADKCTCGLTLQELIAGNRLGCGNCYTTFKEVLVPILNNIQVGIKHVGKTPKNNIESLQKQLALLIKEEKYEEAAIISSKLKLFSSNP